MGEIILFQKYWDRKQKKKEGIKSTEHYEYTENIDAFLNYMSSEVSKTLDKPEIENLIEMEKKDRKKFEQKHKDILLSAPISDADRISYFADIMLNFLPSIFHGEWQNRYEAYMNFSEFYLSEFDTAYCKYHIANEKYEKGYPFRFTPMDADALENELQDCLTQLSSLFPKKNDRDMTEIVWQACKLFELYHNMDDLFSRENYRNGIQHDDFL